MKKVLSIFVVLIAIQSFAIQYESAVDNAGNISIWVSKGDFDQKNLQFVVEVDSDKYITEAKLEKGKKTTVNFPKDFIRTPQANPKKGNFMAFWKIQDLTEDETGVATILKSGMMNASFQKNGVLREYTDLYVGIFNAKLESSVREVFWYRDSLGFHHIVNCTDEEKVAYYHYLTPAEGAMDLVAKFEYEQDACNDSKQLYPKTELEDENQDGIYEFYQVYSNECQSGDKTAVDMFVIGFANKNAYALAGKSASKKRKSQFLTKTPEGKVKTYFDNLWTSMGARQ